MNDEDEDVIMVFEHKFKAEKDTASAPWKSCYEWIQGLESKDIIQIQLEDEESWGHIDELDDLYDYGSTSSISASGVGIHSFTSQQRHTRTHTPTTGTIRSEKLVRCDRTQRKFRCERRRIFTGSVEYVVFERFVSVSCRSRVGLVSVSCQCNHRSMP